MKRKHRTWIRSHFLAVILLLGAAPAWAAPTIPQDVLDAITQDGMARIIVRLDVPFTPEGYLTKAEIDAQRQQIADVQETFETTLKTNINASGIGDPSGVGETISLLIVNDTILYTRVILKKVMIIKMIIYC